MRNTDAWHFRCQSEAFCMQRARLSRPLSSWISLVRLRALKLAGVSVISQSFISCLQRLSNHSLNSPLGELLGDVLRETAYSYGTVCFTSSILSRLNVLSHFENVLFLFTVADVGACLSSLSLSLSPSRCLGDVTPLSYIQRCHTRELLQPESAFFPRD